MRERYSTSTVTDILIISCRDASESQALVFRNNFLRIRQIANELDPFLLGVELVIRFAVDRHTVCFTVQGFRRTKLSRTRPHPFVPQSPCPTDD